MSMNSKNICKWLEEEMLPKLESRLLSLWIRKVGFPKMENDKKTNNHILRTCQASSEFQ